jgi:hypothetical protein
MSNQHPHNTPYHVASSQTHYMNGAFQPARPVMEQTAPCHGHMPYHQGPAPSGLYAHPPLSIHAPYLAPGPSLPAPLYSQHNHPLSKNLAHTGGLQPCDDLPPPVGYTINLPGHISYRVVGGPRSHINNYYNSATASRRLKMGEIHQFMHEPWVQWATEQHQKFARGRFRKQGQAYTPNPLYFWETGVDICKNLYSKHLQVSYRISLTFALVDVQLQKTAGKRVLVPDPGYTGTPTTQIDQQPHKRQRTDGASKGSPTPPSMEQGAVAPDVVLLDPLVEDEDICHSNKNINTEAPVEVFPHRLP